ncbi:MAG: PepSY domain-containing protein [Streptomyces sp.]|nr:PepSY domain-containing protein [Streptomyces sp.]NUT25342.1 PepSY domain-containing protein [Streptomyces sp.]
MRALPRRAMAAAAPAVALLFALTACGGGSDSGSGDSKAADTQQSAQGSGGAQAAGEADDAGEKPEPPLTGDIKQKAEAAALAKYPGTVLKSEEDSEKPGMYAVEIKKEDGTTVEVYLDKSYTVTATKQEGTEEAENDG